MFDSNIFNKLSSLIPLIQSNFKGKPHPRGNNGNMPREENKQKKYEPMIQSAHLGSVCDCSSHRIHRIEVKSKTLKWSLWPLEKVFRNERMKIEIRTKGHSFHNFLSQ